MTKGENSAGKPTLFRANTGNHDFSGDIKTEGISIRKTPLI
jgi:ABC-type branched-subunit amino acid transport system ATPase component